jgi:preprotein translocase subunit YajC
MLMMTSLDNVLMLGFVQDGEGNGLPAGIGTSQPDPGGGSQPSATNPGGNPGGPGGGAANPMGPIWMFLPVIVILILMTSMGGRKERKRQAAMMASLKKRDRVQTQGGIIGVIVEMKDNEVVLKVDEGSNTKIRFAKSAVQRVLRSTASSDEEDVAETSSVS